jgi:hypothetical protein
VKAGHEERALAEENDKYFQDIAAKTVICD